MVGGGATPSTGPLCSEIADFEPIIPRSASAVTPSEKRKKVQLTLIGSPLHLEPKMNIVCCL